MKNVSKVTSLVFGVVVVATVVFGNQPSTQPATKPAIDPSAIDRVRNLVAKPLRLTADAESVSQAFWFKFHLSLPAEAKTQPSDVIVARDGDRVSLIVVGVDGLPYAYVTDGLLIVCDVANPGGLVARRGGHAKFVFAPTNDGMAGNYGYSTNIERSIINADPASMVKGALEKTVRAELDPQRDIVTLVTQRGIQVGIQIAENGAAYPLKTLAVNPGGTTRVGFGLVHLEAPKAPIIGRTFEEFQRLGVPIRIAADDELPKLLTFPPSTFANDGKERALAARIKAMFSPSTTKPAN